MKAHLELKTVQLLCSHRSHGAVAIFSHCGVHGRLVTSSHTLTRVGVRRLSVALMRNLTVSCTSTRSLAATRRYDPASASDAAVDHKTVWTRFPWDCKALYGAAGVGFPDFTPCEARLCRRLARGPFMGLVEIASVPRQPVVPTSYGATWSSRGCHTPLRSFGIGLSPCRGRCSRMCAVPLPAPID